MISINCKFDQLKKLLYKDVVTVVVAGKTTLNDTFCNY